MKATGTIIAAHGRQYRVEIPGGTRMCFTRGKKSEVACGDTVVIECDSADGGVIVDVIERRSLFFRSNEVRRKLIAANIDQIVAVVAVEPVFSPGLLTRCLIAAAHQGLSTLIALNKCDLARDLPDEAARIEAFERYGYTVIRLSATEPGSADRLLPSLAGKSSLLIGGSGVGKSTIVNALVPGARATTQTLSEAGGSGRHTTTRSALYRLDATTSLIDSPGLQDFGLKHLRFNEIERAFPEFLPLIGQCRFNDCRHRHEPGCAIKDALLRGDIDAARYTAFEAIVGN